MFGIWLNAADALVTATIMPSVAREIGGYQYFAWATAGLLLGGIVAGSTAGRLADRLGLRSALALSAAIYAAGCAASAATPDIFVFLLGRVVQGIGGGWTAGLCFVMIGVVFPQRLSTRLFAAASGVWGMATLLGPLVGGVFAGAGHWRWAFWGFALQGLGMAAASVILLPRRGPAEDPGPFPAKQLVLVVAGVVCVAAADVSGSPAAALALTAAGLAVLGLMLRVDRGSASRLLPEAAANLSSRTGAGYAMVLLTITAAAPFSVYGAALLQPLYGLDPLAAGYVVAAESVGWSGVAVLASRARPERHAAMIRLGGLLVLLGLAGIAVSLGHAALAVVVASAVLMGSGFGLSFAFVNGRIVASLPEHERARGSAAVPTLQMTGNAVGASAAGAVANLAGLGGGITAANGAHAAPVLYAAFLPIAMLGMWAGLRVARDSQAGADARPMA